MKTKIQIYMILGAFFLKNVECFGNGEEKFIKKYAMMKVYESCFGPEVLKEIRKEMKEAAFKCSTFRNTFDDNYFNKDGNNLKHVLNTDWKQKLPNRLKPILGTTVKKPIHTTDTLLLQQWTEEQKQNNSENNESEDIEQLESENTGDLDTETSSTSSKPIDFSKLEEAIMNIGKPMGTLKKHGSSSTPNFQQSAPVGYYPAVYYPPPVPFAPSYPYQPYYPGYFQAPGHNGNPAFQYFSRSGHRAAKITNFKNRIQKDYEMKPQLDSVTLQYSSKIRNISCIMQELGYLDSRLEPNYSRMGERISKLQINEELKRDLQEGIKFCKQFSECVPDTKKESFQLSKDLLRPMFFFRCYKHKKLEACIMKDIKERFTQSSEEIDNQVRRSFRTNDIANTIFDFPFESVSDDFSSLIY